MKYCPSKCYVSIINNIYSSLSLSLSLSLLSSSNMKETVCEYFIISLVSPSSSHELPAGIIRVLLSLSFSQYNEYNNDTGLNSTAQCSHNILMETVQSN